MGRRCVNNRQENDATRMQRALELLHSNRQAEARTALALIVQKERRNWEAWHLLGAVHGMLGEFLEAEKCSRKAIELEPGAFGAYINLGHVLVALGKLPDAVRCYRRVLQMKADEPQVHNSLGNLLRQQGNPAEAEASYRNALRYAPDYPDACVNLGLVLQEQGKTDESIIQFQYALKLQPDNAAALHNLGCGLLAKTDFAAAVACYERLVELDPDNVEAWSALGSAYGMLRRYTDAVTSLRRALALQPDSTASRFNLGVLFQSMGEMDQAREMYREALRLDPGLESAQYRLASLGGAEIPARTPASYVRHYFDDYADRFDQHLVQHLGYQTPQRLYDAVQPHIAGAAGKLDVLDLGCGTGLGGACFRSHARTLVGVDLSSRMITKSRQRDIYSELIEGDILLPLQRPGAAYDLIIATDVFVYIGDLSALFPASAKSLRAGGLFAFSIEDAGSGTRYLLRASGRYAHTIDYIKGLALQAGLRPVAVEHTELRRELDQPVNGVIFVLQKTESNAYAASAK
jgi:predicted TPR repeat methyltransferase